MKILALVGSARQTSINKKLLTEMSRRLAELGHEVTVVTIGDFPLTMYNGDEEKESGIPQGAQDFRSKLESSDALIIASPEYNFSMPGGLKNLIDWVSRFRPYPFQGVPTLLASASPSAMGGNRGLWALRVPLEALGTLVHPEMFSLARTNDTFPGETIEDDGLSKRLTSTLESFVDYASRLTG